MLKAEFPLVLASPVETGPLVKEAQRALNRSPFGDFYDGVIDGEYGELSAQAAYRAKFYLGYAADNLNQSYGKDLHRFLTGDAKLSTAQMELRKKRQKESLSKPLAERAFARALTQVGVKESPAGSNLVKYIEWWGKLEWGHTVKFAWCYVFVSWCYNLEGSTALDPRQSRHRYCPFGVNDARAGRNGLTLATVKSVKRGDIVHFDWDGGVSDHVGLFDSWVRPGATFRTVEGNTSATTAGSQSNGGCVARRERSMNLVECFARVTR